MKKIKCWWLALGVLVLLTGCASGKSGDILSPSDLTLAELEKKMNQASDPDGAFAASKSYLLRQEIEEKYWLSDNVIKMVEVKFQKPDKLAITTFEDNKPVSVFCTDGKHGWIADYDSRKILMLGDEGLKKMMRLAKLSSPESGGFSGTFSKVDVHKCTNEAGSFYRIDCWNDDQAEPVRFYIDPVTFLQKAVKMKVQVDESSSFDYENHVLEFGMRDRVRIPQKTRIRQLDSEQECRVLYYQLDPEFHDSEFQPPVFAPKYRRSVLFGEL